MPLSNEDDICTLGLLPYSFEILICHNLITIVVIVTTKPVKLSSFWVDETEHFSFNFVSVICSKMKIYHN